MKYFKYEFKEAAKVPLMFFLISIFASLNFGVFIRMASNDDMPFLYTMISSVLLGVSLGAVNIGTFVINLKRYWNTIYSEQGYFTHTLPIDTRVIYWSKVITATIWSIIGAIVSLIDMLIIIIISDDNIIDDIKYIFEHLDEVNERVYALNGTTLFGFVVWLGIAGILGTVCGYIMIYVSMAFGNLANKRKKALGTGAFIGLYIVMVNFARLAGEAIESSGSFERIAYIDGHKYYSTNVPAVALFLIIAILIFGAIFYIVNRYLIRHKLNI